MSDLKPDWSTAPTWAKWLAQDGDGAWYWYETKPTLSQSNDTWMRGQGGVLRAHPAPDAWKGTCEARQAPPKKPFPVRP